MEQRFSLSELQEKPVIDLRDGRDLGRVCDMELERETGRILRLYLPGRCRWFGLFGREEDLAVEWDRIRLVGVDTILVELP